jgi:phospholipid/cholesterol/gamma-HCH transport system ATP-binding protein
VIACVLPPDDSADSGVLDLDESKDHRQLESDDGYAGPLIEVRNLTKKFGKKLVLDNISLSIEKGKTTVVIGPSGCGKTVLIKHFIALQRPTSGEVYFRGQRIDNLRERELHEVRTHFGYLFQEGALFDSITVAENIMFPIRQHYKGVKWQEVEDVVKAKLAMVGLDGFQNYYPANLSGGQRKRVALARAAALNPEVLLYDEPTTGLDPIRSDIINELILKFERELGVTTVVVTHDMKSAYKVADRIIMLHNGRIIADGDADHIRNHPHPTVQQFINGQVSEDDLAVLRMSGNLAASQFLPRDFQ